MTAPNYSEFARIQRHEKQKQQAKAAVSKMQQMIAHPSVSALVYGYLKEKDLNLKDMSVDQWKSIEKDLVEIILAEIYPGQEATEDQLTFTALANSIKFMSNFLEALNKSVEDGEQSEHSSSEQSEDKTSQTKFEL